MKELKNKESCLD